MIKKQKSPPNYGIGRLFRGLSIRGFWEGFYELTLIHQSDHWML